MTEFYDDFDVWEKHYNDWKNILKNMKYVKDDWITKAQYDYRKELFERLIEEFERYEKM